MSVRASQLPVAERLERSGDRVGPAALARPDVRAAALTGLAFAVLLVVTWRTWGDLGHDTGYDFVAAQRVAGGQLPYVDFTYIYGPLSVLLLGGTFSVLGTSVSSAVALGLCLALATVVLTYALARQVTGAAGAAIAGILAATAATDTGNISFVVPHSTSAPVAVVLCLGALLAAAAAARDGRRRNVVLAGVLAGLVALTRPEFTAAIFAALGLWLALRWVRAAAGADRGVAARDALACAAAAIVLPLVVYLAFAAKVGAGALIHDNLVPRAQLAAGSNDVLKASAPLTASSFAKLAGHLLAYGALIAAMVAAAGVAARGGRQRRLVLAGGALVLALGLAVLIVRPEAVRSRLDWAYAWIPAGAALGALALAIRARRGREWAARDQVALLCVAFLAVLGGKTYAAFAPYPNPDFAQFATYAMPFAAVALCWLHLELLPSGRPHLRPIGLAWLGLLAAASVVLVAHDGRRESFTVRGPGGAMHATPAQGRPLQAALDRVLRTTRPGDPVLLAPQLTALYTLSGRTDPLPEISLLPGSLATASDEDAAIGRMGDVRVAVVDRRKLVEYGQGSFGESFDRRLGAWLRGAFHRTATYRGAGPGAITLDVWERTAP